MGFAPEYVSNVLSDNFEDAKALLLGPLLSIHFAHLVMLRDCGIVSDADARALRQALERIDQDEVRKVVYDGTYEDLFFYLERLVVQGCGEDVAGRLHTARSRNDIDMTMYRMRQRDDVLELLGASVALRRTLLDIAAAHRETIFPAHTHTQPAQPTTLAHYLLAVVEQLERDAVRLQTAFGTTNLGPLGACAITGTGFPIDRGITSELLGFSGPARNTYGSIATVDYTLESLSAASVFLVGLGRLLHDLLLWCTMEIGYLRLPDGFVQGSSIMPQKRNPVALEHARSIASRALGECFGAMQAVHNTPFGDIVDTEDDLQPLVHQAFRDALRAARLVASAMAGARFDGERMRARAAEHWITITELADTLVRAENLPFRVSHEICRRLIAYRAEHRDAALSEALAAVTADLPGGSLHYSDASLAELLSPEHFVRVRRTWGGPSPEETADAIAVARERLARDDRWMAHERGGLDRAASQLRERVAAL